MKRAYEVRCCCQPRKLLGVMVLDVPDDVHYVDFPINQRPSLVMEEFLGRKLEPQVVRLPLAMFVPDPSGGLEQYRALKAEGISIETLRRIPSFLEIL